MSLRRALIPVLFAAVLVACAQPSDSPEIAVDADRMNDYVRVLASDAFEGRGPAGPGEQPTVDYLVEQFQALGLQPGGPDGQWIQTVPLSRTAQDGPATITAAADGWTRTLERGPDILVSSQRPETRITVTDAPLVFVGYGVSAPERDWDDFKGVDLTGKIMVVLVNDPDFEVPEDHPTAGLFDGNAMTFYGRWVYKFQEAARQGAAGVLVIHEDSGAGYGWSVLENSAPAPKLDIVRDDPNADRAPFQGWIQREQAEALMAQAGLDFATLKAAAQQRDFQPVELDGVTLSVDFRQTVDRIETQNVVARVPGAERPDETIIYGAHWDAYGRATPNESGDDIYNGAVDNATGLAALLELGRLFAEGPAPERSVVFMAWAAEEPGLLGAEYYAVNPLWPLETTVANINMDSFLPGDAVDPQVVIIGPGKSQLDAILERHVQAAGRTVIPDPAPHAGAFYRSDHFPLARQGVPALFAAAGFTGHNDASRDYVQNRYHQPTDEWDDSWTMGAAAADVQLLFDVGADLANSDVWPEWTEGDEFEAVRQASASSRR